MHMIAPLSRTTRCSSRFICGPRSPLCPTDSPHRRDRTTKGKTCRQPSPSQHGCLENGPMGKGSNKCDAPPPHPSFTPRVSATLNKLTYQLSPQEVKFLSLRDKRNHHYEAATTAFSYADQLEQLSRPVGRSVGVWLGRAAVAADMGEPAAALDDLELALVQLRKNAKVSRKTRGKRRPPQGRGMFFARVVLYFLFPCLGHWPCIPREVRGTAPSSSRAPSSKSKHLSTSD